MNIVDVKFKVRCEMPNCKQMADIKIEKSGFVRSAGLYLCKECTSKLYTELAKKFVPKSPDNMLNKRKIKKGEPNG